MHTTDPSVPVSNASSLPLGGTSPVSFSELGLSPPLQRALEAEGYTQPTPIQAQAIPHLLAGRDLLGCAQTGTGKTAAFALPILDRLSRNQRPAGMRGPRALILTPTRELAQQVAESFSTYGRHTRLSRAVVYGGVGYGGQIEALRRGVDILVATPGRLLDLMQGGHVRFDATEVLVLDEADRMLDMGFIQPIRTVIAALPSRRQNMLFSATMPPDIARMAGSILVNPEKVAVAPQSTLAARCEQSVYFVSRDQKRGLLLHVLADQALAKVLVFTRTKHGANRVADQLDRAGIAASAIHGNKSQGARQKALKDFRDGRARVLVATDIAARGIDVDGVTHVINFELPDDIENYVHRIGRTARAGASGIALTFCDREERSTLRDVERLTRSSLRVVTDSTFTGVSPAPAPREHGGEGGGRSDDFRSRAPQRRREGGGRGFGASGGSRGFDRAAERPSERAPERTSEGRPRGFGAGEARPPVGHGPARPTGFQRPRR